MNDGQASTLKKVILQAGMVVQRTECLHFEPCDLALIPSAERQEEEALWDSLAS